MNGLKKYIDSTKRERDRERERKKEKDNEPYLQHILLFPWRSESQSDGTAADCTTVNRGEVVKGWG